MKSILLITWANIRRRKIQTILVGICIALAALMFSTLIGIGLGMERPFERLYANLHGSHIVMDFNVNDHNPQEVKAWFEQQEEVVSVTDPRIQVWISKRPIYKEQEFNSTILLREHLGNDIDQDQLDILQGENHLYPGPGEIWIPNHWLNDFDFSLGDTIGIPTKNGVYPLVISAIVVDVHYANGLNSPTPAWLGPGGLSLMYTMKDLANVVVGVRLKDKDMTESVWARFNIEYPFQGTGTLYKFYKQVFQIVYQITGGLLLVFAIFGIIVTLIITSSVVSSAIKTDYKLIGMLKAQGFTNKNIVSVYLIQFFFITCVAVPIGLIGGYYLTQLVFNSLIAAIGAVNFDISLLLPSIGTFFLFLLGISLICLRTAWQATHIQPVTAIRNGGPPQKSFAGTKFKFFTLHPRSNIVLFLGLRFLMSNKKRTVFLFIGLLFVVFVQLLYANGKNSLAQLDENRPAWGFAHTDLSVFKNQALLENEEDYFKQDMEDDDRIKSVVKRGFIEAMIPAQAGKAPESIFGIVYDDELDKLGLQVVKGRHPVFEDEISIGVTSSEELGKSIGDTLALFFEGQLVPYNITGIYQSLNNLSRGFYMRLEAVTEINPLYTLRGYELKLKKGHDISDYKDELLRTYGDSFKVEESREYLGQIKSIIAGIEDVMLLVSIVFLGVLFVTVFNDTVLSIREGQRNLGIFKAIGLTPLQLQLSLIIKSIIIALAALLVGVPFSLYIIPNALDVLTTEAGLTKFPYLFNLNYTLLVIPLVLFITVGSVWIGSRRLLKIRPRILVRE